LAKADKMTRFDWPLTAPLIGRIKIRLFKQIRADDAECGLGGGQQLFAGVMNISAHIAHAPCPMGRPCVTDEMIGCCGCRILDAHMDRGAIVTGIQLRYHRPGHGSIHQGKQYAPMGLFGKGPTHVRFWPQHRVSVTRFDFFNLNAQYGIKWILVYLIDKCLIKLHCFSLSHVPPRRINR
jgi:hypothetical protein